MPANRQARLEEWMRDYGNDVLRIAMLYLHNHANAEDAFQTVFLRAYRAMEAFRGDSSVRTWLIRITVNVCKDMLKSGWNRNVTPVELLPEQVGDDAEDEALKTMEGLYLHEQIARLPIHYKDIVVLHFFEDQTIKNCARILKIPEGTARSRLERAKGILRSMLTNAKMKEGDSVGS